MAGRTVGRAIHAEGKVRSSVLGTLQLRCLLDTHMGMLRGSGYVSLKVGEVRAGEVLVGGGVEMALKAVRLGGGHPRAWHPLACARTA